MKKTLSVLISMSLVALGRASDNPRETVTQIVANIQQADYAGDQSELKKLYDELAPFIDDAQIGSRVRYWRGFDMWRRAINGFNDAVDPNELEQDLKTAIDEFKAALAIDPAFVDAKVGLISCLGYLAFLNIKDQPRAKELIVQMLPLVKEADQAAPENPRLIWVHGPIYWGTPVERGGGQDKAIENYKKGLELYSKIKPSSDPLEPSWGKPEMMMSLAYSYANESVPDIEAAESNARAALAIVPNWHYVRDILLPQILAKKAGASAKP